MASSTLTAPETVALVFLAGFAIQQILQIIDPFVIIFIRKWKDKRPEKNYPAEITEGDIKKAVMAALSFSFGLGTAGLTQIRLLTLLKPEYAGIGDTIVTGLVLGTGTEAVNTLVKFLGYVKDAQKPTPELEVAIVPSAVSLKQGTTFSFRASVKNGAPDVTWTVLHGNGGSIDAAGVYTAPAAAGSFQVMVVSKADPSKHSIATVTVTA